MVHKDIQGTTIEKKASRKYVTDKYLPALHVHGAVFLPKKVTFKQRGDRKLSGQHMGQRSTIGIIHYLHV